MKKTTKGIAMLRGVAVLGVFAVFTSFTNPPKPVSAPITVAQQTVLK